jgi:hypothetical protein
LLTLAADPFLAPADISYFKVVRQDHLDPPRPSACLSDPRSWGATESGARTYTDRHHADLIINEFVLRYDDSASAHRALLNASHQLITCASPRDVAFASDPADIRTLSDGDSVGNGPSIAEYVAQRRKLFPTAQRTEGTETEYTVRAARAGNLLVVIEYSRLTNPQPNVLLTVAFRRAVEGSDMAVFSWCPKLAC